MTPEKDRNLGSDDTAVALEEAKTGRVTTEDGTRGKDSPAEADPSQVEAKHSTEPEGSPVEGADPDLVKKAEFQEVSATPVKDKPANLDLLLDVVVPVSVELGRATLTVQDILSTCQGSVIELDRAAGEPVEILVGGKPLAKGEVVVVKDRFGVRITELLGSIEGVTKV